MIEHKVFCSIDECTDESAGTVTVNIPGAGECDLPICKVHLDIIRGDWYNHYSIGE